MKRLLSVCLALALLAGSLPAALGAREGDRPWEGLTNTWNGNYYGYLNADGEWAIQPMFDSAYPFDDTGHAAVMVNGKYGLIDHTGAYVVEPVYDYINYQYGGARTFQLDGTYGIMEADGAIRVPAISDVDWMGGFSEGVVVYGSGDKNGIMDANGQRITEPIYDWLGPCRGGMLDAMQDGKSGLVAKDGTVVLPLAYEYVSVEEGYIIIGLNRKRGLLDSTGREILPAEYDDIDVSWCDPSGLALLSLWDHFQDGVYQGAVYGVLRLSDEKIVVPCTFADKAQALLAVVLGVTSPDELFDASRQAGEEAGLKVTWYPGNGITRFYGTDRMLMKSNETGLYALCGLDGTNYTGYVFDAVDAPMLDGNLMAMKGGKWGKIDQEGNVLVDFLYDNKEAAKNPIHVQILQKGGLFAIADLKGNLLTGYNYWNARDFVNGYAALQNNQGLWGYIDGYGNVAVPFRYESDRYAVGDMGEDGFAIIQTFEYPGYRVVNARGEELFDEGMGKIWRAGLGMWGFSTSAASGSGKVGFADSQGNIVVEPQYEYYTSPKGELYGGVFNSGGVAEVYHFLGNYGYVKRYIDTSGAEVVPDSISGWRSEGLSMDDLVQFDGPYGFVNDDGEVVVPYIYEAVGRFDHGYASVRAGGVYGMLRNPILRSDWAEEELTAATAAGYVTQRCQYYQTDPITRLQFAELAVNWLEKATGQAVSPAPADTFTDTADEAVLKAHAAGIVQGVGEGRFDPGGLLTREQLATMLWRAMKAAGVSVEAPADLTAYTDGGEVASWATEGLSALVALGVMEGTGGNALSPKASCTVEQAILLAYRAAE